MNRFKQDIKGIIFDVDGVLLDSMGIWTDLGARYLTSIGKTPEPGLAEILFSMSMEQGAEYLKEHYNIEGSADDIVTGLKDMLRDFYCNEVQAKPGAQELLQAVCDAGIRITAATSSPREHIERALERNKLLEYIDRLFTNAEIGKSKHSPDIYDAAAASMGTSAGQTCVFEDSLYALKTAAAAGYYTVGVYDSKGESNQDGLKESADIYIHELCEVTALLR